jgi:hypothetical protein
MLSRLVWTKVLNLIKNYFNDKLSYINKYENRCDQRHQDFVITTQAPYHPQPQPGNCQNFCLNGGSCRPAGNDPYVNCM